MGNPVGKLSGARSSRGAAATVAMFVVMALGAAFSSAGAVTAVRSSTSTLRFSFRGYANNVRVVSPLVGAYQLGKAQIQGSGTLAAGSLQGQIVDTNQPLYARYAPTSMRADVVGYSYHQAAHATSTMLQLTIQITQTDAPQCAVADQGVLTLRKSHKKLSNGQSSDSVAMSWAGQCPSFVQGWTNHDGGARTSPHYGGPPHGGQWAIVTISP